MKRNTNKTAQGLALAVFLAAVASCCAPTSASTAADVRRARPVVAGHGQQHRRRQEPTVTAPRPRPSTRAVGTSPQSVERLTPACLRPSIRRVKDMVRKCFLKHRVPGVIRVSVTIDGVRGRVTSVAVLGRFSGTATGKCVAAAIRTARFPPVRLKRTRFTFPFLLQ